MPYIKKEDRLRLLNNNDPKTEGELNYLLTLAYVDFIKEKGESYGNYGYLRTEIQLLISYFSNQEIGIQTEYNNINQFTQKIIDIINNFYEINSYSSEIRKLIIGALINSSEELYRRKISVYEDKKIIENGDVYDF